MANENETAATEISRPNIVYLDQQIWSGLARDEEEYKDLRTAISSLPAKSEFCFPYSAVHIHELAEIGKPDTEFTERFKRAEAILNYIKAVSKSILLEVNQDYSSSRMVFRDPFEMYETITSVELNGASAESMIRWIPNALVKEVQGCFDVGPEKLNDLSESEAIQLIERGMKGFAERCLSDGTYRQQMKTEFTKHSVGIVESICQKAVNTVDEALRTIYLSANSGNLSEEEKTIVSKVVQNLNERRNALVEELPKRLEETTARCEASFTADSMPQFTFSSLVDQVTATNPQNQGLGRSFFQTVLLDFFGYNSKIKNRRSDFYDALHREYLRHTKFFVTNDERLQEKLGGLNGVIEGTNCRVLSSILFSQLLTNR